MAPTEAKKYTYFSYVCDVIVMLLFLLVPFEFFLPGYCWILFSGLHKRFGFLEELALSFILSLIFASLLTAVLSVLTSQYLLYSVIGSVILSLVLVSIWLFRARDSRHFDLHLKFDRSMLPLIIVAGAYMIMLLLLGWSSPIYPTADAPDPIIHAQIVETILSGSGRALLLHSTSPIGLHFTSAALGFLSGLNGLDALRILLAIVLLDSILLTYCCARTLLDPVAAGFTILVAGFVLPADAIHFIKVGTFPNMLSDAIVLAVLWLIFAYMKKPNLGIGLTLAFLAVGGLFVHSTFLAFLAALWLVLPVFFYFDKASVRNYLKALLFTSGGLLSLALLFGSFLAANLQRILFGSYGVSSAPPTPILLTLQTLVWNYGVLAGLLAPFLIVAAVTRVFLRRAASAGIAFTCIWLGTLAIAMVVSTEGWRFILLSLVPGSFLVGDLLSALFRRPIKLLGRGSRSLRSLAPLLLVVLVISGSFIPLLPRVYAPENRNRQGAIVDSMSWLKQNDNNQSVASVGLSADYRYLTTLTGIAYVGDFNESANSTVVQARGARFAYVAVAVQSPQFPTFESSGVVVEKYQNSVAAIFFIPV